MAGGDEPNRHRICEFVRGADILFIEAVFPEADRDLAIHRKSLTTADAGGIARDAGVRHAEPFCIFSKI